MISSFNDLEARPIPDAESPVAELESSPVVPSGPVANPPAFAFVDRNLAYLEIELPYAASRVWVALSDPSELTRWFLPMTTFEPHVGGRFAVDDGAGEFAGEILAFDAPVLIDFGGEMRFDLAAAGDASRLRVTLARPKIGWHPGVLASYHAMLEGLGDLLAGLAGSKYGPRTRRAFAAYERAVSEAFAGGGPIVRRIHFDEGSVQLRNEARETLEIFVETLGNDRNLRAVVDGHADDDLTRAESLDLARRRAEFIAKELHRHGIASDRIVVRSLGSGYRFAAGRDDAAKLRNRRVELIPAF